MENYVPVLTPNGRPLAPCHAKRARSLVRAGKAQFRHKHGIRCIVLTKTNVPKVKQPSKLQLRIDPGSKHTGIAITRDHPDSTRDALMALVINHRGRNIKLAMTKRRQLRRSRRQRKTRYRNPRFANRTRPADWLPPSLLSRLHNTLTWVRRLANLLPITEVHIETAVFDPQVLRNPEIHGEQYQQGPLYRTNLRAAVLHRDGNKCVYCNRSGKQQRLELDHVVPKSHGGTNRYDNLVAACRPCNQKRGSQPIEQWLKRRPQKMADVQAKLGMEMANATHMNVILPRLLRELRNDGWTVVEHSAASTAAGRRLCSVEKSHHADAALTGCPDRLRYMPTVPIVINARGRGNRQRIMPNKYGTPKGKTYRQYCRLPKHIQKRTPTPAHKKRSKRVHGVATGDYVRFTHQDVLGRIDLHGRHSRRRSRPPHWLDERRQRVPKLHRCRHFRIADFSHRRQHLLRHDPPHNATAEARAQWKSMMRGRVYDTPAPSHPHQPQRFRQDGARRDPPSRPALLHRRPLNFLHHQRSSHHKHPSDTPAHHSPTTHRQHPQPAFQLPAAVSPHPTRTAC